MSRLKTFRTYLLLLIGFYILSTFLAAMSIKTTYKAMDGTLYKNPNITVTVEEAESTFVNGYVKGKISNTSQEDIKDKYLKIDLLSEKGNLILSKYIEINELKQGETKNFTINFQAENIEEFSTEIVDSIQTVDEKHLINLADAENEEIKGISVFLAAIILMKYLL